jgi:hypothetical protein
LRGHVLHLAEPLPRLLRETVERVALRLRTHRRTRQLRPTVHRFAPKVLRRRCAAARRRAQGIAPGLPIALRLFDRIAGVDARDAESRTVESSHVCSPNRLRR